MIGNRFSRRRMLRILGLTGVGFLSTGFGNWSLLGKSDVASEATINASNFAPEQPPVGLSTTTETFETVEVNAKGEIIERRQGSAEVASEDLGDGVTLEMVYIPGGIFIMGAPEEERGSEDYERPQREVTVQPFWMGKYTITQEQWRQVANLPKLQRDLNPDLSFYFPGNDRPVENISWYDVVEFCARLSVATGTNYYLPSEAQWEYACRGGTTTPFHFGETITTEIANYDGEGSFVGEEPTYADEPKGDWREETTPVGSFPPNSFGLYDMHGNVWEWCADPWHDNYEKAPMDGRVWDRDNSDNRYQNYQNFLSSLLNDESGRVFRGGSWLDNPKFCRSSDRNGINNPGTRSSLIGFRVACSASKTP